MTASPIWSSGRHLMVSLSCSVQPMLHHGFRIPAFAEMGEPVVRHELDPERGQHVK